MGLSAFQDDFRAWLTRSDEQAADRLALADRRGLAVYQNTYRAQLMACLEESYPQTMALIGLRFGEAAFHAAAARHIDSVPPSRWTLDAYAQGFPASLRRLFPDAPAIGELADLELALGETFIAPDATALTLADLQSGALDETAIALVPGTVFLPLRTNADAIWSALSAQEPCPAPHVRESTDTPVMIWRQDFVCCFRRLEDDEAALLPSLVTGTPFAQMCEDLVARLGMEDGITRAGALLARWTQAGLLTRQP